MSAIDQGDRADRVRQTLRGLQESISMGSCALARGEQKSGPEERIEAVLDSEGGELSRGSQSTGAIRGAAYYWMPEALHREHL